MLLSTVSILVVAQSIFEIPEGIMNNLVYIYIYIYVSDGLSEHSVIDPEIMASNGKQVDPRTPCQ